MSVPAAYIAVILIWSTTPLAIQWSGDAPIRALTSARVGTVSGVLADKCIGAHRPDGFLLVAVVLWDLLSGKPRV